MKIKSKEFSSQLEGVRRELALWRQQRKHRERIPETLWRAMARLARTHGVSRVSHALRIDYHGLKRRSGESQRTVSRAEPKAATFLELKMPAPVEASGWVAELEDRSGARLTLRMVQNNQAGMIGLVRVFLNRGL